MTYHFKMANRTDAFFCRKTGFGLNCYRVQGETQVLSEDMKTAMRSGRLLDLNGNATEAVEAEAQALEAATNPVTPPVETKEPEAPVAPVADKPVAPVEPPKEKEMDLKKATKDELFDFIKEKGWEPKDLNVNSKTTIPKIIEAINKQSEAEKQ